ERRARAMSVFMIGLPVGLALSFLVSGTIAERWSWQAAFYVAGLPGLLLAVGALFIVDPMRGGAEKTQEPLGENLQEDYDRRLADTSSSTAIAVPPTPNTAISVPSQVTREPVESRAHAPALTGPLPFLDVVRRVLGMPTMWWIIASGALHNFNMYALGTFLASFLTRYHQVSVERAGQVSALVYGVGALGIFAAGWLGDRAFRRGVSG